MNEDECCVLVARIANNVLAGGNRSAYPGGNLFPSMDEFRKQFVGFGSHDYRLVPRSAWLGAGSDGRDLGADLTVVADAKRVSAPSGARRREGIRD